MESKRHSDRQSYRAIVLEQECTERRPAAFLLVVEAYLSLIRFDFYLARGDFESLYNKVRNYPTRKKAASPHSVERICAAVDMACIWYFREALCLQRSSVAACLLKRYGVPAQMAIGTQLMPFKAHAWVEVHGRVVNDKPYTPEMYVVLDKC
jgi:Transglutaminase-like superfamily